MSVRVNLLPEATRARSRASHQRSLVLVAIAGLLVLLGGAYWWAAAQVSDAEERLATEQARTSQLRSERAELLAFQELADRRDRAEARLTAALAGEVSAAGILQDLAAVVPPDTQLESLSITIEAGASDVEVASPFVGGFTLTGRTLTSHAPGVERVLMSLGKIASFRELYLNSSTLDDDDERVATFSLDGQLDRSVTTGRYAEGLPEVLR